MAISMKVMAFLKKITLFFLFLTIVCIVLFIFFVVSSISDYKEYSKYSFFYFLHTPVVLKELSEHCRGELFFTYSAADGLRPITIYLECNMGFKDFESELIKQNYTKNLTNYSLGNTKIQVEKEGVNGNITRIIHVEFI